MRSRKYLLQRSILVIALTALLLSWIQENVLESLFRDAKGELVALERLVGFDRICHCMELELQQLITQRAGNFSALTTFVSSEHLSASFESDYEVPCAEAAIQCAKKIPSPGSFRLLAMLHSSSEKTPENGIVRTSVRDALEKSKKVEIDT